MSVVLCNTSKRKMEKPKTWLTTKSKTLKARDQFFHVFNDVHAV